MAIKIYSYNLSRSLYLWNTFVQSMKGLKKSIVFLQECPKCKKTSNVRTCPGFKVFKTIGSSGDLVIMMSSDLYNNRKKTQILSCDKYYQRIIFNGIDLVNVHMKSGANRSTTNHDKYNVQVHDIKSNIMGKAIVGGDFNINPFSNEMTSSYGWFAKRTINEISNKSGYGEGFVNLFWKPIARAPKMTPIGTIEAGVDDPMGMAIFDQFLIHKDLYEKVKSFGILNHFMGGAGTIKSKHSEALQQKRAKVRGKTDCHWPVYISIDI